MEAYKKSVMEYDDVRSAVEYAREEGITLVKTLHRSSETVLKYICNLYVKYV